MRGKQLIQMLQVLDALSKPGGVTIRRLEEILKVTRRSVERLLAAMQEIHIPVYCERPDGEREKRWLLEASYAHKLPNLTVPNLGLTWSEVICLYLLKRDDPIFKGTRIERWINSVFAKLTHLFPDEIRPGLDRIRNLKINKSCSHKSCKNHETVIRQLVEAAVNQECIRLTYHNYSKNRIDTLSVNPLHLLEYSGGLYLIAKIQIV
ncbi:MAG: hypothetical protein GY737_25410 [Desulfobacteraceae bacterium]|nr:hypothetical protein [Desulfobacteraceae bacterium]